MRNVAFTVLVVLAACKSGAKEVPAPNASADGVEVKTRRSTSLDGKLAWGGLVTNTSDRFVKGVDVAVVVRKGGGTTIGQGKGHVDLLPPHYSARLEVNGIDLSGSPSNVDVVLEHVDVAPLEEKPFEWQPAAVEWRKPLPEGLAFAIEKDQKCAGHLGKKGDPVVFRCVVGIKHTGTRAAKNVNLQFEPVRGGIPLAVRGAHTDLPIEPGDALVFYVQGTQTQPSEMILRGTAEAR